MKCIYCDNGYDDELLPPHRNPDDSLTRRVPCEVCHGAGEMVCPECCGGGTSEECTHGRNGEAYRTIVCPTCYGEG